MENVCCLGNVWASCIATQKRPPKSFLRARIGPHPIRSAPPSQRRLRRRRLRRSLSLSLSLERFPVGERMKYCTVDISCEKALTTRNLKKSTCLFSPTGKLDRPRKYVAEFPCVFFAHSIGASSARSQISSAMRDGLPEDRGTCESPGGFHFILGATRAS